MRPALLACRPVELDMSNELERMAARETFVYEGSVQADCLTCRRKVWVGPRQQEWWVIGTPVFCFTCAIIVAPIDASGDNVKSLGNPQRNPNA